jgi:hypothetical protein
MHLDELKRKTKARIQPFSSIPNPEQLHEAIITGIDILSERSPKLKSEIISIQSGVSAYPLPDDFQAFSELDYGRDGGGMIGGFLFAQVSSAFSIKIINGDLVINPTPASNVNATLTYYANYTPDDNNNYGLTNQQGNAVVIKACEIISRMKADKAAEQAWVQQNEKERVDMSKKYNAFANEAEAYREQFNDAVLTLNSQSVGSGYGTRKSYAINPYDPWQGRILESDSY